MMEYLIDKNKVASLEEKMEDVDGGSEDDRVHETLSNQNRRRRHRRGRRKFKQKHETLSNENISQHAEDKCTNQAVSLTKPNAKMVSNAEPMSDKIDFSGAGVRKAHSSSYPPKKNAKKFYKYKSTNKRQNGEASNRKMPILRPNLLNAPRNSTQFIIDGHEDDDASDARLLQRRHMEQQQRDEPKREFFESTSAEEFQHSPDDETFWAEYCQRDFQTVYESAHREDVENWDKQKLIEEITNLEKRHKHLVKQLSKLDPEVYLRRLKTRLISKQHRNNILKKEGKIIAKIDGYNSQEWGEHLSEEEYENPAVSNEEKEALPLEDSSDSQKCESVVSLAPDSTN